MVTIERQEEGQAAAASLSARATSKIEQEEKSEQKQKEPQDGSLIGTGKTQGTPEPISLDSQNTSSGASSCSEGHLEADHEEEEFIKCSAVHTLERDMPDFDYSHLVRQLRALILEECTLNPGTYSEVDKQKCAQDDWHLSRYLLRQKLDIEAAFEMLKRSMRFNHESLCYSIRPEDFPQEFYQLGGIFGYEPDRKGNKMLYIRVKVHRKTPEILSVVQAFMYYNIKRLDDEAQGKGISLVIDCSGAGLASADMEMLRFLISTLSNYFPKGFSYLLVHELPWLLKPFWHIAKAWVSEEHRQLVKFSDSCTIYEYVEKQNLPDFMGGTCKREYRKPPENCTTIEQAGKLWGIDEETIKRLLVKFKDFLPPGSLERYEGARRQTSSSPNGSTPTLQDNNELAADDGDGSNNERTNNQVRAQ